MKGGAAMKTAKGHCYLCGRELGKGSVKTHLLKTHGESTGQECVLLKVEGANNKNYWLYLDVAKDGTLEDVDGFLRDIWLECCGHLSAFTMGREELDMTTRLDQFQLGDKLLHEYDFGSTTECLVTVMGFTWRKPRKEPVRLLARNNPPQFQCRQCGAPAECICTACMWEVENPFYCEACMEEHEQEEPDHEDMALPVTNSPRMGVCGYCGDADVYEFVPPEGG